MMQAETHALTRSERISRAQKARYAREREAKDHTRHLPEKTDPDVLRIAVYFDLTYGRAKCLKALSYGIRVDRDLLLWCLDPVGRIYELEKELNRICAAVNCFDVRTIHHQKSSPQFILDDTDVLSRIRAAMAGART